MQPESYSLLFWTALVITAQLAAFVAGFLANDSGQSNFDVLGWTLPVAKGAAQAIQVVAILLPFTVARTLLTLLRTTPLAVILPLDQNMRMHKLLGYHFFLWSSLHTVCHLVNAARISDPSRYHTPPAAPIPTQAEYYAEETQITGIVLMGTICIGYVIVATHTWPLPKWLCLPRIAASYEVFYFTHLVMAVAVVVLLVLHPLPGPAINPQPNRSTTWAYMAAGVAMYALERILRVLKQALWSTGVISIKLHPGDVTELRLQKPTKASRGLLAFNGKPGKHHLKGQYCRLKVPVLSRFEWHPFSLTSAPEDNFLSFHIRAAGDWTKGLHSLCRETLQAQAPEQDPKKGVSLDKPPQQGAMFKVQLDGPFGAPAQDHSGFKVLLLVGAGIGVTPYAAVLRQLIHEYNRSLCASCKKTHEQPFKPRKVYFYWMIREERAPEYFEKTLEEIKRMDCSDFLEVNIHLTAALPPDDPHDPMAQAAKLEAGLESRVSLESRASQESGLSLDSRLSQPIHTAPSFFGQPDWPAVFARVAAANPSSRVGVFVCGPPGLASELKGMCSKAYKQPNEPSSRRTHFIFHKENF